MKSTNLINKIFSLFLSTILVTSSVSVQAVAGVVGTPQISTVNGVNGSVVCEPKLDTSFFPVGDSRGINVLTKREESRECDITTKEQGECLRWQTHNEDRSLSSSKYDTYASKNYNDTLGSLLAALGAYDQIEHIWSGWKGYCEIGTKSDFSWAEDPMFWASMAMSFLMQSTAPGNEAAGESGGMLSNTSIGNGVNGMSNSLGNTVGDTVQVGDSTFIDSAAQNAGDKAVDTGLSNGAITDSAGWDKAFQTGMENYYTNIGRCIVAGGFDTLTTAYEFMKDDDKSGLECDPVDEVCGTGSEVSTSESDVMTMDEVQFNDLVQQFATQSPPENIYDFIYVIPPSPSEGIVSFRMKQLNEFKDVASMDKAAMEEVQQKVKEYEMYFSLAITAGSVALCATGISSPDVSVPSSGDRADLRKGASMVINSAAKFMGPYGPIIAAVLKIALYVATSYRSVDSCHNEDDAKELGKRHERTQKSIEFDLCHLVKIECAEMSMLAGSFLQNECVLDGYHYCCYDQILSKILVEQLKAQLGRDWAHCTGISIRDLNYVSFRQCSNTEMAAGFDGAHKSGDYDPKGSFQYKGHCIDMTEFKEYLSATAGMEIDMSDFKEFWNDITSQYTE